MQNFIVHLQHVFDFGEINDDDDDDEHKELFLRN